MTRRWLWMGALLIGISAAATDCARAGFYTQAEELSPCWPDCTSPEWYPLGDSEFVPHSTFALWGSASGGGISNSAGVSSSPSLALDGGGHPVVAWSDYVSDEVYVTRFNASTWDELGTGSASGGGISDNADPFGSPSLVLDSTGKPMVAWVHRSADVSYQVYVKRFDGFAWVEVGAGSATAGISGGTAARRDSATIAVDSADNPVVAWIHQPEVSVVALYVKRFDGVAWVEVGAGSASGGGVSGDTDMGDRLSLALDGSDLPNVAWADRTSGHYEIYVKRFDGVAWVEVGTGSASGGGVSSSAGTSVSPSLTLDGSGNALLAWHDSTSGNDEIYVKRFDGASWQEVGAGSATGGGVSNNSGASVSPSLALDGFGNALVAWQDFTSGNYEIFVKRFDGASWQEVGIDSASSGGVSSNAGASTSPSLALDGSGVPVLAWVDGTSNVEIYVKRFDGASWVEITAATISGGGVSNSAGQSQDPSLALDGSGAPVVAWEDTTSGNSEIYVRRFDGGTWRELSLGSASGGGISDNAGDSVAPSLALDASGNPMVAWSDHTTLNSEIYVKFFDGASWQEVGAGSTSGGGVSNTGTLSVDPSLALGDSGQPVVAWVGSSYEIYVKRFDGASWQEVGAGSASGGGISNNAGNSVAPSLALDASGNPTVAWSDDTTLNAEIYAKRFDGASWGPMGTSSASGGGVSNNAGYSMSPSLAVDSSGNALLAWSDTTSGDNEIYVKRFDGTSWQEVGIGSASDGGVSNSAGWSSDPSLALDGSGNPMVVWEDGSSGNVEVYARRFDGTGWIDLASPEAGGVSNSGAQSAQPSLAIGSGRACVAWSEAGYASTEILLRCAGVP